MTTGEHLVAPPIPKTSRTRLGEIGDVIEAELNPEFDMKRIGYYSHGVEWSIKLDGKVYPLLLLPPKRMG